MRRSQPTEPAPATVAQGDRPALSSRPHGGAGADIEGLAATAQEMAHDSTVAGQPPQGLDGQRAAVEKLGPRPEAIGQGVYVGHQVQGVALRRRRRSLGPARPQQLHQRIGPALRRRGRFT